MTVCFKFKDLIYSRFFFYCKWVDLTVQKHPLLEGLNVFCETFSLQQVNSLKLNGCILWQENVLI